MAGQLIRQRTLMRIANSILRRQQHKPFLYYPFTKVQVLSQPLPCRRTLFDWPVKENKRIPDIEVHPDSIGAKLKPGNLVDKLNERSGKVTTLPVELAHGVFWYIKDIRTVNNKPTISNKFLIPAKNAHVFPELLAGVETLSGEMVELPTFFTRKNRK